MSQVVLELAGIGKAYRQYDREIDRILNWFGMQRSPREETWVLHDINLTVMSGQAIGIVGRNGAGKSTLLKMITGTTRPTAGTIRTSGKIAAILELGMGFNPEFSGRQNVFQATGMMGYQRHEVEAVIGEIEDFSELGDYFEQPLRVYSSGMQVRLAFAVATAFRPDVLIIDEALSVGDAYFQYKSFERIRAFRELGTTLILVSHDKAALQSICDRAVLLDQGTIVRDGDPESVLDYYNALIAKKDDEIIETVPHASGRTQTISGSRRVRIASAQLNDENGRVLDTVQVGAQVKLAVKAVADSGVPALVLGYAIKDRFGRTLFGTNTFYSDQQVQDLAAGQAVLFTIVFPANLGPGSYSISLSLSSSETHLAENYEWRDLALIFTVINVGAAPFDGGLFLPTSITVTPVGTTIVQDPA